MIFLFNWVMLMFHLNFRGSSLANLQGMGQEMVIHSKGSTKIMRDVFGESYQWSVNSISAHYLWSTEKVRGFWDPSTHKSSFLQSVVSLGGLEFTCGTGTWGEPAYHHGNWRGHPPPALPSPRNNPHYRSTITTIRPRGAVPLVWKRNYQII